jgi:hypothetical protein
MAGWGASKLLGMNAETTTMRANIDPLVLLVVGLLMWYGVIRRYLDLRQRGAPSPKERALLAAERLTLAGQVVLLVAALVFAALVFIGAPRGWRYLSGGIALVGAVIIVSGARRSAEIRYGVDSGDG